MIVDAETNGVYFSNLIKKDVRYSSFWKRLTSVLLEKKICYNYIENTRDIWCRDYMPIQIGVDKFIQFDYFPDYYLSPKHIAKLTIQSDVRLNYPMEVKNVKLVIDGGNIVKSDSCVILTEKVLKDNPTYNKTTLISILKKELEIENIYLIPQLPYDITGHADGMVRFLDESNLLVADYSKESKSWRAKMDKALEKTGLNIIRFPAATTNEKNEDGDYTAKGVYINFMHIENYILFPQFGLDMDDIALDYTKELYPHCEVIPIDSSEIAKDGGVLNCISWNIQVTTKTAFCSLPKSLPCREEQEIYVFSKLDFYFSTFDYMLIADEFQRIWDEHTGELIGDADIKKQIYRFLERSLDKNYIPQYYVDRTVDLILEYLESIGQYGFPLCEN